MAPIQNSKRGFKIPSWFKNPAFKFRIFEKRGVTLLLVMIILSALLSISIGIFDVVFGEIRISGEINDSFVAFYAADQGIERTLYLDRVLNSVCSAVQGPSCYTEGPTNVQSGGCYNLRVDKISSTTTITVSGQYRCDNPNRVVKRGFEVSY